jgi:RNA polymerase sigma factor (sigma-70 family)
VTCLESLLKEYQETLKETKKMLNNIKNELLPLEAIIEDSTSSKRKRIEATTMAEPLRYKKTIVSGMISELEYAIKWMKTGRQPGNRRGVERLAAYQRERPFDPVLMQRFFRSTEPIYSWEEKERENVVTLSERLKIESVLSRLTDKEKEIFLMSRGYCLSYSDIAKKMNVTKAAIQRTIARAEKKISEVLKEGE